MQLRNLLKVNVVLLLSFVGGNEVSDKVSSSKLLLDGILTKRAVVARILFCEICLFLCFYYHNNCSGLKCSSSSATVDICFPLLPC